MIQQCITVYIFQRNKISTSKRHLHTQVHCSIIRNSQEMEKETNTQVSVEAHPLYTIRTAAVPDPSRNESPKFQRQHKRASHFTAWPLIRATRAANTLLCQGEKRGWSLVGLWGEQEPTCTNAAASPRSSQLRVPAPRSRLRSQIHFDLRPSHPASLGRGLCPS